MEATSLVRPRLCNHTLLLPHSTSQRNHEPGQIHKVEKQTPLLDGKSCKVTLKRGIRIGWEESVVIKQSTIVFINLLLFCRCLV